jgi:hypothetical protein
VQAVQGRNTAAIAVQLAAAAMPEADKAPLP